MKLLAWTEEKEARALVTGAGVMTTHKGDTVVCFIVERWDDSEKAIESLRMLMKGDKP